MKKRFGRRGCDNGWKSIVRDYGVGGLFVVGLVYVGVQWNKVEAAEAKALAHDRAIEEIVKVQRQRAREMGHVSAGLNLMQEQLRIILQTMLEKKEER